MTKRIVSPGKKKIYVKDILVRVGDKAIVVFVVDITFSDGKPVYNTSVLSVNGDIYGNVLDCGVTVEETQAAHLKAIEIAKSRVAAI